MRKPLAWPSARALSHWLWYGRSVRAQLLIVFMLIDVIAGLIAGVVTILQARTSTRIEIAASMELAERVQSTAADAPLCFTCGTKMRPAGSCYVCEGCGSTSGCS